MLTVLVLRGGADAHDVSLKTGNEALRAFSEGAYRPIDVFVDKELKWHIRGMPVTPERAFNIADTVFNALHGFYGEDGEVQKVLERAGISFTGSGSFSAALAMNKPVAKEMLQRLGVKVPRHVVLTVSPDLEREALEAFRKFSPPVVIKPALSGISSGVTLARTWADAWTAIEEAFAISTRVLVEEFIVGKEATVGVIENFRDEAQYALLPVEIAHPSSYSIFDRTAKRSGEEVRAPGNFTRDESEELARLARLAHTTLGLTQYSRSDFIVSPRGIYFLEANALPPLGVGTAFSGSLQAAGASTDQFVRHLLTLSESRR